MILFCWNKTFKANRALINANNLGMAPSSFGYNSPLPVFLGLAGKACKRTELCSFSNRNKEKSKFLKVTNLLSIFISVKPTTRELAIGPMTEVDEDGAKHKSKGSETRE